MSIIFILILISALSSYIVIVNDQVAHGYDIVIQLEKHLKSFYETEFVIYYVVDFCQKNYEEIDFPFSKKFDLYFSPEQKRINFSIECDEFENDFLVLITIPNVGLSDFTLINCRLFRDINDSIKLKSYQIEKKKVII